MTAKGLETTPAQEDQESVGLLGNEMLEIREKSQCFGMTGGVLTNSLDSR